MSGNELEESPNSELRNNAPILIVRCLPYAQGATGVDECPYRVTVTRRKDAVISAARVNLMVPQGFGKLI